MKRALKLMAAALAAVAAMSYASATAFADKLRTVDGVTYRYSDTGEQLGTYTGWTKNSVGKRYCINGILVRNKWLKMKSGKRFYAGDDGYISIGWTHIGENWYYISSENGRLSGTQSIDGIEYTFDINGKWNKIAPNSTNEKHSNTHNVYSWLTNGKHDDIYGEAEMPDGMLVIWSVNGQAEKLINKRYPGIGGIIYKPTKYSVVKLEEARAGIIDFIQRDKDKGNKGLWSNGPAMYRQKGCLVIELSQNQYDRLSAYIDSLPYKDCIDIRIGESSFSDDSKKSTLIEKERMQDHNLSYDDVKKLSREDRVKYYRAFDSYDFRLFIYPDEIALDMCLPLDKEYLPDGWRFNLSKMYAEKGSNIYSIADGTVIYANEYGDFGSYGATIVIEHKDGYVSMYSGLNNIYVKTGQYVKCGELIANLADHTIGKNVKPYLSFELYKDMEPVTMPGLGVIGIKELYNCINNIEKDIANGKSNICLNDYYNRIGISN